MSFKPLKAKTKLLGKPKPVNDTIKLPKSIAATALNLTLNKFVKLNKDEKQIDENLIEAIENKDTSTFHNALFKKGINVLRPEIVFTNEFAPIVSERSQDTNKDSLRVKYDNNTFIEVTNSARLLELHQMLRSNSIQTANEIMSRYGKIRHDLISVIIKRFKNSLSNNFNLIYDKNLSKMRKNLIEKSLEKENNYDIRKEIESFSEEKIILITDYVMNDYISKELIKFIAKIFDYKELLEKSLGLYNKKPLKNITRQKINKSKNFKESSLGKTFQLSNFDDKKQKSEFLPMHKETNFENFINIVGHLDSLINFNDSIYDIENTSYDKTGNQILNGKRNRLNNAIQNFKKINFPGCFGIDQRKTNITEKERMIGSNITSIFNDIGRSNTESFAELMAVFCYDQVAGSTQFTRELREKDNILSNGKKFTSIQDLLSKELYNINNSKDFKDVFRKIKISSNQIGNITKFLFDKKTAKDGKTYRPFETVNTIAGEIYDDNKDFPAEEIYFTSSLKSNDDFEELNNFLIDFKSQWNSLTNNIIRSLGLDFDENGKKSDDNLNTVDQLNPISYLNCHLNTLADDLESCYLSSDSRLKKSLLGLAMVLNDSDSIDSLVSGYKSTLMGILINEELQIGSLLSDQTLEDSWIDKNNKSEGVINTIYSETEAQTEKRFLKLLKNLGVTNPAKGKRSFPNGGKYDISLTATGLFDGSLGTFNVGSKINLGAKDANSGSTSTNLTDLLQGKLTQEEFENNVMSNDFKNQNYGKSGDADVEITKLLNLKVTTDWLGPVIVIAVAVLIIATFGAAAAAGGSIAGLIAVIETFGIIGTGLHASMSVVGYFIAMGAIAGTLGVSIGAGVTSLVTQEAVDKSKPVGVQITSSGIYTLNSLINLPLSINVFDKDTLYMPNITEKTSSGENLYFFKNKNGKKGKFDFKENLHPGEYGGIKKFSAIHSSFLLHYLAADLLSKTQNVIVSINDKKELIINFDRNRMRGLISALKNESIDNINGSIDAYDAANEIIVLIKEKIIKRKDNIIECLDIIHRKIDELIFITKNLQKEVNNQSKNSPLLHDTLINNDFYNTTIKMINPSYKDYLSKSYYQNFIIRDFSTFPMYENEDINDLKIMYKVLSSKNYGFLEKEKLGRKNIFHVGIPVGMMDYLRRAAYKETNDEDYLDSSLIMITIHKNNQLNLDLNYKPKQLIFDMSKHIMSYRYDDKGNPIQLNHIKKASDDKSLSKIIKDMEVLVFDDNKNFGFKSNGIGIAGITGNRTSDTKNNYDEKIKKEILTNHIFDYYLKTYTKLCLGIDLSETNLLVNSDNIFSGEIDNQFGHNLKKEIFNKFLIDYPTLGNTEMERELFSRSLNVINNSVLLSSNNRLKEMTAMNCFERIYSILINDKDFLIDTDEDLNQIYESTPSIEITSKIQSKKLRINNPVMINDKTIKSYIKEMQEKSTTLYGFSIEVGILKKW